MTEERVKLERTVADLMRVASEVDAESRSAMVSAFVAGMIERERQWFLKLLTETDACASTATIRLAIERGKD